MIFETLVIFVIFFEVMKDFIGRKYFGVGTIRALDAYVLTKAVINKLDYARIISDMSIKDIIIATVIYVLVMGIYETVVNINKDSSES